MKSKCVWSHHYRLDASGCPTVGTNAFWTSTRRTRKKKFFALFRIGGYHAVDLLERSSNPLLESDLSNPPAQESDFRFSRRGRRGTLR